jgi:hypothetical protein
MWKRCARSKMHCSNTPAARDGHLARSLVPGPHRHPYPGGFEGNSQWVFFDGNYQEYEADKKKRLGEEGAKPKRVRFKALK